MNELIKEMSSWMNELRTGKQLQQHGHVRLYETRTNKQVYTTKNNDWKYKTRTNERFTKNKARTHERF